MKCETIWEKTVYCLAKLALFIKFIINVSIAGITVYGLWLLVDKICTPRIYKLNTVFIENAKLKNMSEENLYVMSNAEGAVLIAMVLGWCGIAITLMNILSKSEDDR